MPKDLVDMFGSPLEEGDHVITIKKNEKAVGGDLVEAVIRRNSQGTLFLSEEGATYSFGMYRRLTPEKLYKLPTGA